MAMRNETSERHFLTATTTALCFSDPYVLLDDITNCAASANALPMPLKLATGMFHTRKLTNDGETTVNHAGKCWRETRDRFSFHIHSRVPRFKGYPLTKEKRQREVKPLVLPLSAPCHA